MAADMREDGEEESGMAKALYIRVMCKGANLHWRACGRMAKEGRGLCCIISSVANRLLRQTKVKNIPKIFPILNVRVQDAYLSPKGNHGGRVRPYVHAPLLNPRTLHRPEGLPFHAEEYGS